MESAAACGVRGMPTQRALTQRPRRAAAHGRRSHGKALPKAMWRTGLRPSPTQQPRGSSSSPLAVMATRRERQAAASHRANRIVSARAAAAVPEEIPESELSIVEAAGVGLKRDLRTRLPSYLSDFKDGFNIKCLASTCFMFFACLAPAVAFGSLLQVKTQGVMGALEMLVSTSICGMTYAIFSGQPVTIIGSTGPVLAFTAILYEVAQRFAVPFLPFYAWVGLWTSGILGLCAIFSTSNLVIRYLSRFTDEIFAGLISVIFVVEAAKDIIGLLFQSSVAPATALLSIMMAVSVCTFALTLTSLRASPYMNKRTRDIVADFGPTISIVTCTVVCLWLSSRYDIALNFLKLPDTIAPSTPRPWLVNIFDAPMWVRWASAIPAVMVSILMFFDQNITTRLVNSKDNKMKKGYGYHVDLLVVSFNTAVFSLLGMPWLVAATVRSVNHLRSLTNYETVKDDKDGASYDRLIGIQENRVTNFCIHALIGVAIVFGRGLLRNVPQCVLMGLFLYLGFSAIKGNTFLERIELFFTDKNKLPDVPYVKDISLSATKKFTLLQVGCLAALVALKESRFGILFPVVIALLQVILVLAVKAGWFTKKELEVLDD